MTLSLVSYEPSVTANNCADEARVFLNRLGRTPDEIAAKLERLGVRGVPGDAHDCALATYLRPRGVPVVDITGLGVSDPEVYISFPAGTGIVDGRECVVDQALLMLTPTEVEFVHRFDHGRYPALVATLPAVAA